MALGNTDVSQVDKIKEMLVATEPDIKAEVEAQEPKEPKRKPVPEDVEQEEIQAGADDGDTDETEELDLDDDTGPAETPATPALSAPSSFTAEEKALFASLPPDLQQTLVRREKERTSELRKLQTEQDKLTKAMEAERQAIIAERSQISQTIAQYGNGLIKEFQSKFADVTDPLALARTDPVRATEYKAYIDQINLMNMEMHRAQEAEKVEAQKAIADFRQEQNRLLREKLNLDTDDKFNKFDTEITEYATKLGIPADRLYRADALSLEIAHKAMLYDRAVAKRQQTEKAKAPPPFVKAGVKSDVTAKDEQYAASRKRLGKTGSLKDAAAALRHIL